MLDTSHLTNEELADLDDLPEGPDAVPDFEGEAAPCLPTHHNPIASLLAKIQVMRWRAQRGQNLFHPQDGLIDAPPGRKGAAARQRKYRQRPMTEEQKEAERIRARKKRARRKALRVENDPQRAPDVAEGPGNPHRSKLGYVLGGRTIDGRTIKHQSLTEEDRN